MKTNVASPGSKFYLSDIDPPTFDAATYVDSRMPGYASLSPSERRTMRVAATRDDPLLWAIVYFNKTLTAGGKGMTFADMHFDLCRIARHFRGELDPLKPIRYAFLAPRRAGKTSWLYKILVTWMAAHGHRKFVLTLTGTGGQAIKWITNFKMTIETNRLLREDYPEMCSPARRPSTGRAFADDQHMFASESGFTLAAQGTDGNGLGLNWDDDRPDLLLFDDVEPPGGSYSIAQMNNRLSNIVTGALPMGAEGASVIFVGTVLMTSSIMDQFREYSEKPESKSWIAATKIRVKWYKPFVSRITGEQTTYSTPDSRSFWEGRHKLANLLDAEGSREFAFAYANEPLPENGAYWRDGDIRKFFMLEGEQTRTIPPNVPTVTMCSVDPAVSATKKSDFTAVSIIRYAPSLDIYEVLHGTAIKLNPGTDAVQYVMRLLARFPEVTALLIETNQGGKLWDQFYGSIPGVQMLTKHQSKSKSERAALVLTMCQTGQVFFGEGGDHGKLEKECMGFPNALHDDLVDAFTSGVLELQRLYGPSAPADRVSSYV